MTDEAMWFLALLESVESMEISILKNMLAYSGKWRSEVLEWLRREGYIEDLEGDRVKITHRGHKDFIREVLKDA